MSIEDHPRPWKVEVRPTGRLLYGLVDASGNEIYHITMPESRRCILDYICECVNAEDIMRRRSWGVAHDNDGWFVSGVLGLCHISDAHAKFVEAALIGKPTPSKAINDAEIYFTTNIEGK